jgi:lipopolysaccharide assembly outer membrane protein LptD (OstA)
MVFRALRHSVAALLALMVFVSALATNAAQPTALPHKPDKATPPPPTSGPQVTFTNISGFDYVQARRIGYNFHSTEYKIPERFRAVRSGTELTADSATGTSNTKIMHAMGHVVIHQHQPLKSGGDVTKVTQDPSTLTCDKLDADGARQIYVATGNVHFTQAAREGSSDTATLDDARHMLHMEGNVHLRDKEQFLDADILDYNTETGETQISGRPAIIRLPIETPTPGPPKTPTPKKRRLP